MKKNKKYIIGVDGGGTKTDFALADLKGKILTIARSGPASPRNLGIENSVFNVAKGIKEVLKKTKKGDKIISTFVALPSIEEEYKDRKGEILKKLKAQKGIYKILKGKILIGSDQITAFRSGANEKDGVLLIAGTGCAVHGWREGREVKTSGWGWLTDEGSAFWIGQKALQAILKELDGRGKKTLLTKTALKRFNIEKIDDLLKKVYTEKPTEIIPELSIICDKASRKRDKVAKKIMVDAGKELSLAIKAAIHQLNFQKVKFSLVLVGSEFKSNIILNILKKEVRKTASKAQFILPRKKPVYGAIKLALESLDNENNRN